jgi:hypothetical protein
MRGWFLPLIASPALELVLLERAGSVAATSGLL